MFKKTNNTYTSALLTIILIATILQITCLPVLADNSYTGVIYGRDIDKPETSTELINLQSGKIKINENIENLKIQNTPAGEMPIKSGNTLSSPDINNSAVNGAAPTDNSKIVDKIQNKNTAAPVKPTQKKSYTILWILLGALAVIAVAG